ncbi:ubiquinone biosynthesis accessory factor UbiJ [Aliikangiella coralliicola]|uniref:Ubiquinone biosynthesis accessory factor UbiJ n=1 Tax=Aliikangiella coralliicola TaxID=2592383 RepID=A0A545UHM4_9GAMM|nr:SCP2 sterol-binding domain-containing protein [Aliikangiella coralliicola]TQV88977.1 hypothetical protein FLL46_05450 [Aliikangiella coralliicola]
MLTINRLSATFIEQVGNRILNLDAEAHQKLKEFENKVIHIEITDLQLDYYFIFPNGTLVVQDSKNEFATAQAEESEESIARKTSASISGKLRAFLAAASAEHSGDSVFTGDLHFSGEINTAKKFQDFVQSLEIDWQEPLSQLLGDEITHFVSRGVNHAQQLFKNFVTQTRQDVPEYLQEEVRVTPTQTELDIFFETVDLVRSQTDRLQARLQRLQIND